MKCPMRKITSSVWTMTIAVVGVLALGIALASRGASEVTSKVGSYVLPEGMRKQFSGRAVML